MPRYGPEGNCPAGVGADGIRDVVVFCRPALWVPAVSSVTARHPGVHGHPAPTAAVPARGERLWHVGTGTARQLRPPEPSLLPPALRPHPQTAVSPGTCLGRVGKASGCQHPWILPPLSFERPRPSWEAAGSSWVLSLDPGAGGTAVGLAGAQPWRRWGQRRLLRVVLTRPQREGEGKFGFRG